ncbi:MAG: hypothetical protein UY16_C0075G0003 [Candidatus Gottesmanbacteria bacterium GW2011_GWA2_47_9]|uniref:Uncharacterized protein n=1 Tax=Candidatus Gottesmanbacteria bacterium GW2011_GWA2_47_9 TaxID=1618445 RepID=A0A0G1TUP6_9BACT|nr:MAG: hypothetical protein UY16_C0075G0003 [Candidatus Gottesmanbacteria bacterium GW2011_GWA2_47_9]
MARISELLCTARTTVSSPLLRLLRGLPGPKQPREFVTPLQHGLVTFGAFVIAGVVPIIPYLFSFPDAQQFLFSSVLATAMFFSVGAARTYITKGNFLKAGLEMLAIGVVASSVAYGVGWGIKTMFGIAI